MKQLAFITALFYHFACFSQKSEYIIIKHIGEQLSSIDPVTIILKGSKPLHIERHLLFLEKYKFSRDNRCTLDTALFTNIGRNIFHYQDSIKSRQPKEFPHFGSFKVSYFKNDRLVRTYSMYSLDESKMLFNYLQQWVPESNENEIIKLKFLICIKLIELKFQKVPCKEYENWK